jgi:hypothetical protein
MLVNFILTRSLKDVVDCADVLSSDLFTDLGEHSHTCLPVIKLISRPLLVAYPQLADLITTVNSFLDLFRPLFEGGHEAVDHSLIHFCALMDLQGFFLVFLIKLL